MAAFGVGMIGFTHFRMLCGTGPQKSQKEILFFVG
jgi:hypothetical protein